MQTGLQLLLIGYAGERECIRESRLRLASREPLALVPRLDEERGRLQPQNLSNMMWALAVLDKGGRNVDLFRSLQEEVLDGNEALDALLEVLWASAFSEQLPVSVLERLKRSVLARAPAPQAPPRPPRPRLEPSLAPRVVRDFPDRLVVHKPPGWQARAREREPSRARASLRRGQKGNGLNGFWPL